MFFYYAVYLYSDVSVFDENAHFFQDHWILFTFVLSVTDSVQIRIFMGRTALVQAQGFMLTSKDTISAW